MRNVIEVEFGEWLPDLADYNNPGLTVCKNVLPTQALSYAPLGSLEAYSSSARARVQGAFAAKDSSGNAIDFCGDASDLYKLAGTDWTAVSNAGYSSYGTAATEVWNFEQYGNLVVATNYNKDPQKWTLGSATAFKDLSDSTYMPKCRYIRTIKDFLVLGNLNHQTLGVLPNAVAWSILGTIDTNAAWPAPSSTAAQQGQSDYQVLPEGGWVQGIAGAIGGTDGAVFLEDAIYRMQYEGPPTIFRFDKVEKARGTPAPKSIVNIGPLAFYIGNDGIYAFDGAQSTPIGASKIDKTFFADLDQNYLDRITGIADPINKIVMWSYPGSGNTNGTPNKIIAFNWQVGRWAEGEIECEMIWRSRAPAYTLEQLDAFGTLESMPQVSFDSRIWSGGAESLSAFDTSHRMAYFTGQGLTAQIDTAEAPAPNGSRARLTGIRPIADGGTITTAVSYRNEPDGSLTTTTYRARGADGFVPFNHNAKLFRVSMKVSGSWSHAKACLVRFSPDGSR